MWKDPHVLLLPTLATHTHTPANNKAIKITTTIVSLNGKQPFLACLQLKLLFLFPLYYFSSVFIFILCFLYIFFSFCILLVLVVRSFNKNSRKSFVLCT